MTFGICQNGGQDNNMEQWKIILLIIFAVTFFAGYLLGFIEGYKEGEDDV